MMVIQLLNEYLFVLKNIEVYCNNANSLDNND